jgi:hypothetical protein
MVRASAPFLPSTILVVNFTGCDAKRQEFLRENERKSVGIPAILLLLDRAQLLSSC